MKKGFKKYSKQGVSLLLAFSMIFSMMTTSGLSEFTLSAYAAAPSQSEQIPGNEQEASGLASISETNEMDGEQQDTSEPAPTADDSNAGDGATQTEGEEEQLQDNGDSAADAEADGEGSEGPASGDTDVDDSNTGDSENSTDPAGDSGSEGDNVSDSEEAAGGEDEDASSDAPVISTPEESGTEPQEEADTENEVLEEEAESDADEVLPEDDYSDLMTIEELLALDEEEVGATIQKIEQPPIMLMSLIQGNHWTFDIYYVNEADSNSVYKTNDFNLKYQMEFHANQNFKEKEVEIRIPAALYKDRDGNQPLPADIAVPKVENKESDPVVVRNSPFNYYIDTVDGTDYLVFFNYKEIVSGTNSAWQVLYKKLDSMKIIDETKWDLAATIKTDYTPEPSLEVPVPDPVHEEETSDSLLGEVNTQAVLTSVSKTPYSIGGKSYGPGLYTKRQVQQYVGGTLPADYDDENFDNYYYVIWSVRLRGSGNQPFDLWFKDTYDNGGKVIGVLGGTELTVPDEYSDADKVILEDGYRNLRYQSESRSWEVNYSVVVAYDKATVHEGDLLTGKTEAVLIPTDLVDESQHKSDDASWTYTRYHWIYTGDTFTFNKTGYSNGLGWLDVYRQSRLDSEKVADDFSFSVGSSARLYNVTHVTDEDGDLGARISGKAVRVSMTDDAVYAYPNGAEGGERVLLDKDDYYFSSVNISINEHGYDPFEDTYAAPETAAAEENVDQNVKIYAMFAKSGTGKDGTTADSWELVDTVAWDSRAQSGTSASLTYRFPEDKLLLEPYRVMAVHDTIAYDMSFSIGVSLALRYDSPKIGKILDENADMAALQIENFAGLDYDLLTNGEPNDGIGSATYFEGNVKTFGNEKYNGHWLSTLSGYSIPSLTDFTNTLYGGPIIRDDAIVQGLPVGRGAYATKSATSSNDVINGRVNVVYSVTEYDGYEVSSSNVANYLVSHGLLPSPARNSVVFYDLLPYGMKFDPSYAITAGRITNLGGSYQTQPRSWNSSDVDVKANVVDTNYNNTGRTMIAFTVTYNGQNTAAFYSGRYFEGWGINYRGYWNWEDLDISNKSRNVCAIMPAKDDNTPFIGDPGEIYDDDGNAPAGYQSDYKFFGKDIDDDGEEEKGCVLYAHILSPEDVAVASTSSITKYVRADADRYSVFGKSAVVKPGGGYTYEITVTNPSRPINHIVVFDRLENAIEDRKDSTFDGYTTVPGDIALDESSWTGTFSSVVTEGLLELGVTPTIYYNADRNAKLPAARVNPADILTEANGWFTESKWAETGKTAADVKAVAVDFGNYTLDSMKSASFQICMTAPGTIPEETWAYNNPSFYSEVINTGAGEGTKQNVIGNSASVRIGEPEGIEVIKKITNKEDTPASFLDQSFEFFAYEKGEGGAKLAYANKEYTLYTMDETGAWIQDPMMHGTDANGKFTLKDNQKATFANVADAGRVYFEETESPFWKVTAEDTTDNGYITHTFSNEYRPVLYVKKTVSAIPKGYDVSDAAFKMQVLCNGEPAANVPFWYVTAAYTDGRQPTRVTGKEAGTTDSNGYFTIHPNEVIALLGPGKVGDTYTVTETETGDDWVCKAPTGTGELNKNGASVTITDYFKWKDILLAKTVTHQSKEDADKAEFKFKVELIGTAADGSETYTPVSDNEWILEVKGDDSQNENGTLADDGTFTCHATKGTVRIRHLEAEKEYRITEVLPDDSFYLALNNGEADVTMPLYSTSASAAITNDWQKRPLEITKTLLYDLENADLAEKAKTAVFEMTVQSDTDGDGTEELLTNFPFTLTQSGKVIEPGSENDPYVVNGDSSHSEFKTDGAGKFLIMGGQTVTFEDAGIKGSTFTVTETANSDFLQVYPARNQPQKGSFDTEGQKTSIINGSADGLLITKEWTSGDPIGEEIIGKATGATSELYKALSVHLTMKVKKSSSAEYEAWPETDATVSIVDTKGNVTSTTWKAASGSDAGGLDIHAGESVAIVSGLDDVVSYEVTEARAAEADDSFWCGGAMRQYKADDKQQYWVSVEQIVPNNGRGVISGTIKANPAVTFVNNIDISTEASEIHKRMTKESSVVPDNSKIVFVVEKYGSGTWAPVSGIEYMLPVVTRNTDEQKVTISNERFVTEDDGKIVIETWSDTYPHIAFMNDVVHILDVLEPKDGDLRIRELTSESDSEWGMFVGVGGIKDNEEYTMDLTKYVEHTENGVPVAAFVNSNADTPIRIGKDVEGVSNSTFTMVLDQITGVDGDKFDAEDGITPLNYSDVITESVAGKNIGYSIYDSATGEYIGSGVTDENGHISLKAGQYAEIGLPDETMWTVSEQVAPKYTLEEMTSQNGDDRLRKLTSNLMLVGASAAWNKPYEATFDVKYAVSIYGIKQDLSSPGLIANVTFGPATGADYRHDSVYCPGTSAEDPGTCMHWMTWEEIADVAQHNPESLKPCLENGCTHGVELKFEDDTILGESCGLDMLDGDGVSVLYRSIGQSYCKWNNENTNNGGWAASRARAVLNGSDEYTADGTDVDNMSGKLYGITSTSAYAGTDMASFTADRALISAFPAELRDAIVPKAVVTDTRYNDYSATTYTATTYDKLWYLSGTEVYQDSGSNNSVIRNNEGLTSGDKFYERSKALGISTNSYSKLIGFYENGSAYPWWLRSSNRSDNSSVSRVFTSGNGSSDYAINPHGIAPCFCLGTSAAPREYDVKYAVSIYGINQDKDESGDLIGLTFGPATGESYLNGYKACDGTSESDPGNCIHWMTWDEIIEVANTNPESFRDCLNNGCTHSVELSFTDKTILGTSYKGKMNNGDGASILYNSIGSIYRAWNYSGYNYGGWAASRARAVLNGADEYTADGTNVDTMDGVLSSITDTSNYAGTDMEGFGSDKALISAFPTELQEAIVPKAVVADTRYNDVTSKDYTATTYDKLWYFSGREIRQGTAANDIRDNEGLSGSEPYYERSKIFDITSSSYTKLKGFYETGSAYLWWLRSAYRSGGSGVCYVNGAGDWSNDYASSIYGVAPGFCIG